MGRRFLVGVMLGLLVASSLPAATAQAGPPGRYIVVLKDSVSNPRSVASEHSRDHGAQVSHVYQHALKGYAARMSAQAAARVTADRRVAYVEADQLAHAFAQTTPTGIKRTFAASNAAIDIDSTDDNRVDVDVAIIDTGIDFDHPDLNVVARTDCAGGGPFNSSCTNNSGDDGNGHGTHVAGTVAALDNDLGVVGMAPGSRLWAVRVLDNSGSGYISWIVAGIDYVTANASSIEVANMSLGCECSSDSMDQAIAGSVDAGIVYAVAAGNSDADAATHSPANHTDVITVSALADFDGVPGGLGSPTCRTDEDDTLANFSNFGSTIEIAAPGVCILSTWKGGGYDTISGTSMASPHVAGGAALLASKNNPSNQTDVEAIESTLVSNGNLDWTDDSGDCCKERLLDVGNTLVFNPAMTSGTGGGGDTNTAPVANDDSATTEVDTSVTINVLANDSDVDGDSLSVTNLTQPSNGSATLNADNTVTYTPAAGFTGSDSFTYTAHDGTTDSNVATVSITVQEPTAEEPDAWGLTVTGTKFKGTKSADLAWNTGATSSTSVDVYRDGVVVTTTANDGAHQDVIGKGGGDHTYKVCEASSTTNCSDAVTVSFN